MGRSKTKVYQVGRVYRIKGKTSDYGAVVINEEGVPGDTIVTFEDIYTGNKFTRKQQYRSDVPSRRLY
jgi:hypothetical protein